MLFTSSSSGGHSALVSDDQSPAASFGPVLRPSGSTASRASRRRGSAFCRRAGCRRGSGWSWCRGSRPCSLRSSCCRGRRGPAAGSAAGPSPFPAAALRRPARRRRGLRESGAVCRVGWAAWRPIPTPTRDRHAGEAEADRPVRQARQGRRAADRVLDQHVGQLGRDPGGGDRGEAGGDREARPPDRRGEDDRRPVPEVPGVGDAADVADRRAGRGSSRRRARPGHPARGRGERRAGEDQAAAPRVGTSAAVPGNWVSPVKAKLA